MSYQYSNFPNEYDFQNWEYFENINNIDKDNINADKEYLVDDNKRISAQFVNTILDAIRAIERFVQDQSKKKPNMSDVEGVLPIAHGGTGATTAANALKNFGLTATAAELNYTDGVTSNIQTQLDGKALKSHTHNQSDVTGLTAALNNKLDISGENGRLNYTDDFCISTLNGIRFECSQSEIMQVIDSGVDIQGRLNVTGDLIVTGNITNTDLTAKLDNKASKTHTHNQSDITGLTTALNNKANVVHAHTNATVNTAGFMSAADKKKLDDIAEGAGQNMDNYVSKSGSGNLNLVGYSNIYLSPTGSFYIESGGDEVINVSAKGVQISRDLTVADKISAENIATNELRISDVMTSNGKPVYTIHTDVSSGEGNRLDFFKIIGSDSLVKMTFTPNILNDKATANGKIEIEGDVDIDSGNILSVRDITSDSNLSIHSAGNYSVVATDNIDFFQNGNNTARLTIKGANSASTKGGTLVFSRNDRDILRIGEKDDADGQPVYNQFRFDGDEFKVISNGNDVITINDTIIKMADGSGDCKIELQNGNICVTPVYFSKLGFDISGTPEMEAYLKGNSAQQITYDILQRITALEDGSSGGGGNCEAITEAELNAMFDEIGL